MIILIKCYYMHVLSLLIVGKNKWVEAPAGRFRVELRVQWLALVEGPQYSRFEHGSLCGILSPQLRYRASDFALRHPFISNRFQIGIKSYGCLSCRKSSFMTTDLIAEAL